MTPLHHVRRGSGPPLVLMHGIGMDWRAWEPVLGALAERREVIPVDLPGFGLSPPLPGGVTPTVPALTDAVERFLERLGLERPHVAGNSLGGAIALELARRGTVASATALSPAGVWTDRERRWCQRSLGDAHRFTRLLDPFLDALVASPIARTLLFAQLFGRPWRMPPHVARRVADVALAAPGWDATLRAFDAYRVTNGDELAGVPVTVAWAKRDWLLLPRQGRRVPRVIPHARLVWLERCGHCPMWDDPARVTEVLLAGSGGG